MVDSKLLFREKKRLLHEIELSDTNSVCHNGAPITKSECIRVIDDLDDENKREFHYFIYQNKPLDDFLSRGELAFFERFRTESIYRLEEFLDFVSPYFSFQYNKVLVAHFQSGNIKEVRKIISVTPVTNEAFFENCYISTWSVIRDIGNEIDRLIKNIEAKEEPFVNADFNGLDSFVFCRINIELLNLLPSYFQGIRNQTAQSIKTLAKTINNDPFNNYLAAFKAIEIANNILTDGLVKQDITKGYYIIKENYTGELNRAAAAKKDPLFEKYLSMIDDVFSKMRELENKTSTPALVMNWVSRTIPFTELNSLDNDFDEIKKRIAVGLRGISVEIWNKFSEINPAIFIIEMALSIVADAETRERLISDKTKLIEIRQRVTLPAAPEKPKQTSYTPTVQPVRAKTDPKKDYSGCLVFLMLGGIIGLILIISNSGNRSDQYHPSTYNPANTASSSAFSTSSADSGSGSVYNSSGSISIPPLSASAPPVNNLCQPVKMKNGNISGCSLFHSAYDYEIDNKLVISAGTTDAAVKLINDVTGECIRFVFIKAGTTYSVRNIPQGRYYLKIAYGDLWSVLPGTPKCKGHFTLNAMYKKGEQILDFFMTPNDNGYDVPSYNLRLNMSFSDRGSNAFSSDLISETAFENN